MPRGVDQVEHIRLPIGMGIKHPYRRGLDGDAPLPLDLHGIQELVLHIPQGHSVRQLHHPIRQGGFPVIDVGNDAKIPNIFLIVCHDLLRA